MPQLRAEQIQNESLTNLQVAVNAAIAQSKIAGDIQPLLERETVKRIAVDTVGPKVLTFASLGIADGAYSVNAQLIGRHRPFVRNIAVESSETAVTVYLYHDSYPYETPVLGAPKIKVGTNPVGEFTVGGRGLYPGRSVHTQGGNLMRGIPNVFNTKQDWLNTHQYAMDKGDEHYKAILSARLSSLKNTGTVLVLKESAPADPEEQTPEDFEAIQDPRSALATSGLSVAEIDLMISQLG